MKAHHVTLVLIGLVVVFLLGLTWPLRKRSKVGFRLARTLETQQLATRLESVQDAAKANLQQARALQTAAAALRADVASSQGSPFVSLEPEKGSEEPNPVSGLPNDQGQDQGPEQIDEPPDADEPPDIWMRLAEEWPELTLTGVVLAGEGSLAVVNNEVYKLGTPVAGGLMLQEVHDERIVLVSPEGLHRELQVVGWSQREEGSK